MTNRFGFVFLLILLISLSIFFCPTRSSFADAVKEIGPREIWEPFPKREQHRPVEFFPSLKNFHFEIAPEAHWFFYEEPSLSVKWKGILYGARAAIIEQVEKYPVVAKGEIHYAIGRVDYDGFLSNGTPHTDEGTDWFFDGRMNFGYEFIAGRTSIIPFLGLGYRYWLDDLESANAYERDVRYLYSPIGFEINDDLGRGWSWGIAGEFDFFWRGWVDSHLEDVNASFNTVKNVQDSGYGARGSLYVRRNLGKTTSISIEPFVRYWDIDESNTAPVTFTGVLIGSGVEPANHTIESGLQISVLF